MTPPPCRHLAQRFLIVAGLLLGMMPASAASVTPPAASARAGLGAQIDALIRQPRFATASWGIAVASLDSGRMLYAHRADKLLQPASTAKLFTAALSLAELGPDYHMTTRLLSPGKIRNGRLDGPLVLYGTGDPTLGTAGNADWATRLASQLAARGIKHIHGDLIADDSYFTGPTFGTGWEAGDLQSWFAVPSSALSVDENIVNVTVKPGASAGMAASITLAPVDGVSTLLGRIDTTLPRAPGDINLYRAPGSDTLYAFGSVPANSHEARFRLAMTDPAMQAGRQLRQALLNIGIRLTGTVRVLHWPQDDGALLAHADILAEVRSPPLLEVLQRGLKRSQNLYLQNLLLNAGAHEQATEATRDSGFSDTESHAIHALRRLLTQLGIAPDASWIAEGTGLSRRDLVTPDAIVHLLGYLDGQPYAAQLRAALPLAGVDGTLVHRMRNTAAAGNLQAKTGSMTYVHCLAGYVTSAGGERLAFAIMLNNYEAAAGAPRASRDVDAIAILLANYRGEK
ncbi:MAG TPA: D-alanyl-D-alanine carboxypeptidase/D-alanyl-D-alanine-endopeptidase [Rhodanobacter sp.]|nr:D-alanyl-D-alanine carboxypeptidase/D-alanyl-D-alanine-endopeptidase [Rhodanobacter sp.]